MAEFSSRSAGHTNVHDHTNDLSHINELSVDILLKRDIPDLQMLYQRGGKKETQVYSGKRMKSAQRTGKSSARPPGHSAQWPLIFGLQPVEVIIIIA